MAILKCKMCGGDILLNEDKTTGTCDHCGSTMTFPRVSDEQKLNLYNRANHFRRQNEFDKAITAYERILEQDDADAEAHWGAVLSRYGIEYVEDPVTHERIPTCHRVQPTSILSDEDYLAAIEYAPDTVSRDLYEQEARRIADIQKGILAISSQEKPYDVFICYKETDDAGQRTKDSTLAQDIYYQLTNEGYKVFFSRITLEDKLGTEYEPYIFAALNSARVMLVIGTKPEYLNSVWVKNEWSRYLALMKTDRGRLLIPCYREMDPYDLPEDLGGLQSQDMSKIGFMQDLIRGVKKILDSGKKEQPATVINTSGPGVASLHRRAVLFLEDGDWDAAKEYFDRILDIDPEYAPAYIGKVQVTYQARKEADLARGREPIKNNPDYQKALRFANEQQKAVYAGYNRAIEERLDLARREGIYREGDALEKRAAVEADFLAAAKQFDEAGNIRDAKERAANCRAKAAAAKAEAERAAEVYRKQMEKERQERAKQEEDRRRMEALRRQEQERQEEERRQLEERKRQEERREKERRKKRNIRIVLALAILALLGTGAYFLNNLVIQPTLRYNSAQALLDQKQYDEAAEAFGELANYRDSADKVKEAYYQKAQSYLSQDDLNSAFDWFNRALGYSDAREQAARISNYQKAEKLYADGQYLEAREAYAALGDFKDAKTKWESVSQSLYEQAKAGLDGKDIAGAYRIFSQISDYRDSAEIIARIDGDYQAALALWQDGKKEEAETALKALRGWSDVEEKLQALREEMGDDALAAGDYEKALEYYELLPVTDQVRAKINEVDKGSAYASAQAALAAGELAEAYNSYVLAGDYQDAAEMAASITKYVNGSDALKRKDYAAAREAFLTLGDFLDAPEKLEESNRGLYDAYAALLKAGDVAGASAGFQSISDYADSAEITARISSDYRAARKLLTDKKYDEAEAAFLALKNYGDCETQVLECRYQKANSLMEQGDYKKAASIFDGISAHKDSVDKAKEAHYQYANSLMEAGKLQAAAEEYKNLESYADAAKHLVEISTAMADEAMANKDYAAALTAYLRLEQTDEIKAKEYNLAKLCHDEGHYEEATTAYEALGQYELSLSRLPVARYAWADQLFKAGEYAKAAEQFALLDGMTDSAERAKESNYLMAKQFLEKKRYDLAKSFFVFLTDYKDAASMAKQCDYEKACDMMKQQDYQDAQALFESLGVYSDSKTKAEQCIYNQAEALLEAKAYMQAKALYDTISYSDSKTKAKQCVYNQAEALFASKQYSDAKDLYASIDYEDSKEKANQSAYLEAAALYDAKKYADAEKLFLSLKDYSDSADRAKDSHLQQGNALMQAGDYQGALKFYETVEYGDSAVLAAQCHYALGRATHTAGNVDQAVGQYAYAVALPEARTALMEIAGAYAATNDMEKAIQALWLIRDDEAAGSMLKEIGSLKEKTGEFDLAMMAYAAAGNGRAIDDCSVLNQVSFEAFSSMLQSYTLLPEMDVPFSKDMLYYYGIYEMDAEHPEWAILAFEQAGDYSDAKTQILEAYYQQARSFMEKGDYDGALGIFSGIKGYKDVDSLLANDHNLAAAAAAARDAKYSVGNYVTFGHYPQTSGGNDNTPIEWLVLARDGNKALLLSRYGLDTKPYNEKYAYITWEKCTLRTWLNGTFLNKAFTAAEQKGILLTNVDNGSNQGYSKWSTSGGNNTQDRVFLLSYAEANKYLGVTYDDSWNTKSRVAPTAYAIKQGAYTYMKADGTAAGWWWLRSPGLDQSYAAIVSSDGPLGFSRVHNDSGCVRPALWLNLESGIF